MKKGFTLAEVLVTLAIIGVVATITLPAINTNVASSEVGPKVMKSVSVLEQANKQLLADRNISRISLSGKTIKDYIDALSNYINITESDENSFVTRDGIRFSFEQPTNAKPNLNPAKDFYSNVQININSNREIPRAGRDLFFVTLFNNGSILPIGLAGSIDFNGNVISEQKISCGTQSSNSDKETGESEGNNKNEAAKEDQTSEDFSSKFESVTSNYDYTFCAANIFQNGGKIKYENSQWRE